MTGETEGLFSGYPSRLVASDVQVLIGLFLYGEWELRIVIDHVDLGHRCRIESEMVRRLHLLGLIDRADTMGALTDKGRVYCEHLLNMPLPIQTWTMPDPDPLSQEWIRLKVGPHFKAGP